MSMDKRVLTVAFDHFGIKLPKPVAEHRARLAAATAVVDALKAETEPTIDDAADIAAAIRARVDYRLRHDQELQLASELQSRLQSSEGAAWAGQARAVFEACRKPWNDTIEAFQAAVSTLGGNMDPEVAIASGHGAAWNAAQAAANELTMLWAVRRELETAWGHQTLISGGRLYSEGVLMVLAMDSHRVLGTSLPIRLEAHGTGSAAWWAAALATPGVTPVWQDRQEEEAAVRRMLTRKEGK